MAAKKKEALPESVKLSSHYGFIDDEGHAHMWVEGATEIDAIKIKMLIERRAPIESDK